VRAAAVAFALALAATAHASVARADELRTTVSIEPRAFVGHGVAAEVERDLPAQRLSLAGAASLRSTAGGDYDSSTIGLGAELRYWFRRDAIWSPRPRGSAIGWYAAARIDVQRTSLSDGMDASLGSMTTYSSALLAGYRFAPWRGLEIRPYVGLAQRIDTGGDLPSWRRGSLVYGVALGWSF
jgi:hypothetical protein